MSQILPPNFMYFMQSRYACNTSFTRPAWLVVASSTFGMMYDYIRLHMQATDIYVSILYKVTVFYRSMFSSNFFPCETE